MSNDLVVVTLTFKILSGPYPRNCKVDSWMVCWLESAGMQSHGVISSLGSVKV